MGLRMLTKYMQLFGQRGRISLVCEYDYQSIVPCAAGSAVDGSVFNTLLL